ncbi:MAG: hypothetical protein LBI92_06685 [Azoarcus sp.]|jgi:hypothetical protein|nr:hypothetical protein [Azoarcus sp.]
MPKKTLKLEEVVPLWRRMTQREWREGRLCGHILVEDENVARALRDLLDEENENDYPCVVSSGDPDNIQVGETLALEFGAVRTGIGLLVADIPALLKSTTVAVGTAPQAWYVVDSDLASWEESGLRCRLFIVYRLLKALGQASIFDSRQSLMVFLDKGRLDVPVKYVQEDLFALDKTAASAFIEALEQEDGHSVQRRQICATSVCEMLREVPQHARFGALLQRLPELHSSFLDGYRLFVSAFSYEKVRDQAEALRIEYTGKIHKTISDIQGQLLGIPISTVVIATQFKPAAQAAGQGLINVAVLLGAIFFFLLFLVSAWNQLQTLKVIETEIARQEKSLRQDGVALFERLNDVFTSLRCRVTWQRRILYLGLS